MHHCIHWCNNNFVTLLSTEAVKRCSEGHQFREPCICLLPHCCWRWAFLCQPVDASAAEGCGAWNCACVSSENDSSGFGSPEPIQGPCIIGEPATLLSVKWHDWISLMSERMDRHQKCSFPAGSERLWTKVQKSCWHCCRLWQAWRGSGWLVQIRVWICWSGYNHSKTPGGKPKTTCFSTFCRPGHH